MFYSKTTNAFYDENLKDIYNGSWPDDVIEITKENYQYLLNGQSDGKLITADKDGNPVLVDQPPLTSDQLRDQAIAQKDKLLSLSSKKIAPLQDAVDLDMASDEEVEKLKEWKKYRVLLNRIESQSNFPDEIDWPQIPS